VARTRAGWQRWYRGWEEHQEAFNRNRERRFRAMFELVAASLPARFTALDLGAGPGALSARLLRRFPQARCVAVDYDPVVLRVGQGALGTFGGRLRWVEADLGSPGWDRHLPFPRFDAALSTTALHWLDQGRLGRLYRDLGRRLRRGGIFLDGDRLPFAEGAPELARLAEKVRRQRFGGASLSAEWWSRSGPWRRWWEAAERDPELGPLFPERARRGVQKPHRENVPLAFHLRALRRAGFRPVEVLWRDAEDAVLFARR
jgi:SAM-dependent methyltransferase